MIEKEIKFRKKRELGELISDSFDFIKQEYKPISKLILTYVLPFLILYGIVQVYFQMKVIGKFDLTDPEAFMANIDPLFYKNLLLYFLFGIFVQSLLISTFYSYIEMYIKKGKGNFELSEITPYLFSNGLLALGAGLIWFIVTMFGFMLCVLPGIYFANTFSLVVFIVLFERKGLGNALSRSWSLVNTQWWATLLLSIVGILIIWTISFVIALPTMILSAGTNVQNSMETGNIEQPLWYWVLIGINTVISSLFWIIPYTFLAFQYFNLDERTKVENTLPNKTEQ